MPRPEEKIIQLTVDGREVQAPEGMMLVDAAKRGDVDIPYFCYEPKLGHPVGACRMCLVEVEGIPKLQTSIIGNCLCVLGDSMAMPIGSMIEKFRDELESEIEQARLRAGAAEPDEVNLALVDTLAD